MPRYIPPLHLTGAPDPERRLRFLEIVRRTLRERRYSRRTEEAYVRWIRRYIVFHGRRHPGDLGESEVQSFLSNLAVAARPAARAFRCVAPAIRSIAPTARAAVDQFSDRHHRTSTLTVFDLAFVVLCFTTVISAFAALVAALRGRRDRAGRIMRRVATAIGAYALVLLGVSVASPQRFSPLNANQCSDDWCIAADTVLRETTESAVTVSVRFRLSSRARRVTQRERFVVVYLRTADGRRMMRFLTPPQCPSIRSSSREKRFKLGAGSPCHNQHEVSRSLWPERAGSGFPVAVLSAMKAAFCIREHSSVSTEHASDRLPSPDAVSRPYNEVVEKGGAREP